jgi:hypothetical protein
MIKKIKILIYILILVNISCQDKKSSTKESIINQKSHEAVIGHTFFRITETDKGRILYQPCDADIATYRFYEDSIYHNWGQEPDVFKISKKYQKENEFIFNGQYSSQTDNKNSIKVYRLDVKGIYWKIDNEIFIDSLYSKTIKYVEQPMKDCGDEPITKDSITEKKEIQFSTINSVKGITFSIDCNSTSYVHFLVGGQFITPKLSMNTKLEKINETEFNIYFSTPLMDPIDKNMNDYEYFSEEIPIATAKRLDNKIEFIWLGFYNTKTKKRIHLENPFTNRIEKETIILNKCN